MSEEQKNDKTEPAPEAAAAEDPGQEEAAQESTQSGPKFTEGPDPLSGLKQTTTDMMASMEGKTVSMKVYVGSIIAVIVLMLLARCGG